MRLNYLVGVYNKDTNETFITAWSNTKLSNREVSMGIDLFQALGYNILPMPKQVKNGFWVKGEVDSNLELSSSPRVDSITRYYQNSGSLKNSGR